MNRIIAHLIIAAPFAAAAVTLAPTAAMADSPSVLVGPRLGPEPMPIPVDLAVPTPELTPPVGPDDLTVPLPDPTPPVGPDDLTVPLPDPTPPVGPGDFTALQPCPTHGGCGDDGGETPEDDPEGEGYDIPTRIDAGSTTGGGVDGTGLELSWILAGGAMVLVSGAVSGVAYGAGRQRRLA